MRGNSKLKSYLEARCECECGVSEFLALPAPKTRIDQTRRRRRRRFQLRTTNAIPQNIFLFHNVVALIVAVVFLLFVKWKQRKINACGQRHQHRPLLITVKHLNWAQKLASSTTTKPKWNWKLTNLFETLAESGATTEMTRDDVLVKFICQISI